MYIAQQLLCCSLALNNLSVPHQHAPHPDPQAAFIHTLYVFLRFSCVLINRPTTEGSLRAYPAPIRRYAKLFSKREIPTGCLSGVRLLMQSGFISVT